MNMLMLKSRKSLVLYIIIGIVHSLLTMYISIPISEILPVPHTWNRNVWTVIIIICTIIVSFLEKKRFKVKYIWILATAIFFVFVTSFCCAVFVFLFTPSLSF